MSLCLVLSPNQRLADFQRYRRSYNRFVFFNDNCAQSCLKLGKVATLHFPAVQWFSSIRDR